MTFFRASSACAILTSAAALVAVNGPRLDNIDESGSPGSPHALIARIAQRYPDREFSEILHNDFKEQGHAEEMLEWWYGQRAFPNELMPPRAFGEAVAYKKASMPVEDFAGARGGSGWTSIGPDNVGGRVLSIAVDPAATNRVWAGMAAGGLWLSTTGGVGADAWDLIDTGFPTVSVSGIAIDDTNSNNMWIATGEIGRYGRGQVGTPGARSSYGLGVLRSTDGGATWSTTGLDWTFDQNRAIQALKMDPVNSQILWAASTEGVYKTTNGGTSWTLSNAILMAMDLVVDPANGQTVFASHGQLGTPADPQAGIYRTTNGGTSWTKLAGGLPTTNFGRTSLAIAPSAAGPSVVFAGVSDSVSRQVVGLYRSVNTGTTWTLQSSENWASAQAWYDNVIAVNPLNVNRVYAAGLDFYVSTNGGPNLAQQTFWFLGFDFVVPPGGPEGPSDYVHADSHAITFDPLNPAIIYVGCDGGVFKSEDNGTTWAGRNGGLVTTQFYAGLADGNATQALVLGGLQDNGTVLYTGSPSWSKVFGGDGGWCAIDPTDESVFYEEYVYSEIYKSDDSGHFWFNIHSSGGSSSANFIAPFVLAPSSPNILYAGTLSVEKTTNGGNSWFFPDGDSNWNGTPVNTIGVAPTNANYVLAGTGSSATGAIFELRRSTNGGTSWTNVTAGLPNRYLTDVSYDSSNLQNVWITFSGYGTAHVFRSTDAGLTWSDRSGNLPDIPCQTVVVDSDNSNVVFVGTDLGIFRSQDGGTTWSDFGAGLPPCMVLDLNLHEPTRLLRACTFGNGVYERDLTAATGVIAATSGDVSSGLSLAVTGGNPFRDATTLRLALGSAASVEAAVYDLAGRRVRGLFTSDSFSGAQAIQWDGRNESGERVASGTYFVRAMTATNEVQAKVTLLR